MAPSPGVPRCGPSIRVPAAVIAGAISEPAPGAADDISVDGSSAAAAAPSCSADGRRDGSRPSAAFSSGSMGPATLVRSGLPFTIR
jgi:hypothetical protein